MGACIRRLSQCCDRVHYRPGLAPVMGVDRGNGNCGMPDLGCGMSGSPDWIATQDLALVSAQGGASTTFHEGCETIKLGHHQRGSELGQAVSFSRKKTFFRRFVVLSPRGEGSMAALSFHERANPATGNQKAGRGMACSAFEGE